MAFKLTYKRFGERSILVEWPAIIDKQILQDIINFEKKIVNKKVESIVELKTAYNSLLIIYHSFCSNFKNEVNTLKQLYVSHELKKESILKLWTVPVCYDRCFGIDLEVISTKKKIPKEAIIRLHSQAIYTVYFIGFLPGFLYLGGLHEILYTPRKYNPRLKIEKGAVAIGGKQTGVYPNESPGGWNVIGNSPIEFFDTRKVVPCFAKAGDKIVFNPISFKEHANLKLLVDADLYQLESVVMDD